MIKQAEKMASFLRSLSTFFCVFILLNSSLFQSVGNAHRPSGQSHPVNAEITPSPQAQDEGICLVAGDECDDPADQIIAQIPDDATLRNADLIVIIFWMKDCVHCTSLMQKDLPGLSQKYASRVSFYPLELKDIALVDRFYQMGNRLGIPANQLAVPLIVIEEKLVIGAASRSKLEEVIDASLANAENNLPDLPEFAEYLPEAIKERQSSTITPKVINNANSGFPELLGQTLKLASPTLLIGILLLIGLKFLLKKKIE
jgi:hypothetical protein